MEASQKAASSSLSTPYASLALGFDGSLYHVQVVRRRIVDCRLAISKNCDFPLLCLSGGCPLLDHPAAQNQIQYKFIPATDDVQAILFEEAWWNPPMQSPLQRKL
ncbi:hypothetical protein CIRG_08914 [Coccidioides immitis RMSCC 2394]|uniref:Uncharacterized protein n=1 Tax=Coccidioides immitis RMSCC 2394 TaxID=404692 RepID=A0A0J6YQH7_COCIT|nr:hypothetical protein CIRG_08914 [Coccidioides immitis RMSCC 2394]